VHANLYLGGREGPFVAQAAIAVVNCELTRRKVATTFLPAILTRAMVGQLYLPGSDLVAAAGALWRRFPEIDIGAGHRHGRAAWLAVPRATVTGRNHDCKQQKENSSPHHLTSK
jgi:hypothetical protein